MHVPTALCALLFVLNAGHANAFSPAADSRLGQLAAEQAPQSDDGVRALPIKQFDYEFAAKEMLRAKYKFANWMNIEPVAVKDVAFEHAPQHHGPDEHHAPPPGHPGRDDSHDAPDSPHDGPHAPHDGPHHHHRHGKHGRHEHGPPPFLCRLRRYLHNSFRTIKSFFVGQHPCPHRSRPPPPSEFASPDFLPVEISAEMMPNSPPRPDASFVLAMIAAKFFLLFGLTFHLARRYRARRAQGAIRLQEEETAVVNNEKVEIVIV